MRVVAVRVAAAMVEAVMAGEAMALVLRAHRLRWGRQSVER